MDPTAECHGPHLAHGRPCAIVLDLGQRPCVRESFGIGVVPELALGFCRGARSHGSRRRRERQSLRKLGRHVPHAPSVDRSPDGQAGKHALSMSSHHAVAVLRKYYIQAFKRLGLYPLAGQVDQVAADPYWGHAGPSSFMAFKHPPLPGRGRHACPPCADASSAAGCGELVSPEAAGPLPRALRQAEPGGSGDASHPRAALTSVGLALDPHGSQARHAHPVASSRLAALLAVEVAVRTAAHSEGLATTHRYAWPRRIRLGVRSGLRTNCA